MGWWERKTWTRRLSGEGVLLDSPLASPATYRARKSTGPECGKRIMERLLEGDGQTKTAPDRSRRAVGRDGRICLRAQISPANKMAWDGAGSSTG